MQIRQGRIPPELDGLAETGNEFIGVATDVAFANLMVQSTIIGGCFRGIRIIRDQRTRFDGLCDCPDPLVFAVEIIL